MQVLYNEMLALAQKLQQAETQKAIQHVQPSYAVNTAPTSTFQDFMNRIPVCEFEDEFKALYKEIQASDLTSKQKELLYLNMRQSNL